MVELMDRKLLKEQAAALLETAQVSPKGMTALYLALGGALTFLGGLGENAGLLSIFLVVLTVLLSLVLDAGFVLYCMAVRRRERAEYLTLFDGFSMAGKFILLALAKYLFIFLWSLLFVIPGIIAAYRYRFALYNLLENPELGVIDALNMSKQQTMGYKGQIFMLDVSYLGWSVLASLPACYYNQVITARTQQAIAGALPYAANFGEFYNTAAASVSETVWGMPAVVWQVIIALWALAVSLFYLPNYICVQLDYFEAAKRSSGVGVLSPWENGDGGTSGSYGDDGGYSGSF